MAEHINGPLHWEQLGKSGRPIVFVHPNPMDHTCWMYQMAHLAVWYRCIGVDLPGYGKSPTAQRGLTMDDVAQACWEAVEEVTTDPAIIVGLSVGAHVVQHMASLRPKQTLAVVVSGTGFTPGKKEFALRRIESYERRGVAFRYEYTLADYSPTFRETDLARYFATIFMERNPWTDIWTICEMFRALAVPTPESLPAGIRSPMLIITGSLDTSHESAFDLQRLVPDCEVVTMEGAGHACNMERPWEWDAHFLRFIAKHGLFDGHLEANSAVAVQ